MTFLSTDRKGTDMPRNTPTVLTCLEHYIDSRGDWATNTRNNNRSVLTGFGADGIDGDAIPLG
jgi:hypothetical protein